MIVKVGTANLCDGSGRLAQSIFNDIAMQVVALMN